MIDEVVIERIKPIVERLRRKYNTQKVILFGSYARGEAVIWTSWLLPLLGSDSLRGWLQSKGLCEIFVKVSPFYQLFLPLRR